VPEKYHLENKTEFLARAVRQEEKENGFRWGRRKSSSSSYR
jgi:hypothetical protein